VGEGGKMGELEKGLRGLLMPLIEDTKELALGRDSALKGSIFID